MTVTTPEVDEKVIEALDFDPSLPCDICSQIPDEPTAPAEWQVNLVLECCERSQHSVCCSLCLDALKTMDFPAGFCEGCGGFNPKPLPDYAVSIVPL